MAYSYRSNRIKASELLLAKALKRLDGMSGPELLRLALIFERAGVSISPLVLDNEPGETQNVLEQALLGLLRNELRPTIPSEGGK